MCYFFWDNVVAFFRTENATWGWHGELCVAKRGNFTPDYLNIKCLIIYKKKLISFLLNDVVISMASIGLFSKSLFVANFSKMWKEMTFGHDACQMRTYCGTGHKGILIGSLISHFNFFFLLLLDTQQSETEWKVVSLIWFHLKKSIKEHEHL